MSITHYGEATGYLKKGGFNVEMMKTGQANKYKLDASKMGLVFSYSDYSPFKMLNKAGQQLAKSKYTTYTEGNDESFIIIQAKSNWLYQSYMQKIQNIKNNTNENFEFDDETKKIIKNQIMRKIALVKEAERNLKKIADIVKKNENCQNELERIMAKSEAEQKTITNDTLETLRTKYRLDKNITISTDQGQPSEEQNRVNQKAKIKTKLFIYGLGFIAVNAILIAPEILLVPAAGLVVGVTLGFAIAAPICALVNHVKRKTATQREHVKAFNCLSRAIRNLNEFNRWVRFVVNTHAKAKIEGAKINSTIKKGTPEYNDAIKETQEFLAKQTEIWEKYTQVPYYSNKTNEKDIEKKYDENRKGKRYFSRYHINLQKLKHGFALQWQTIKVLEDLITA